MLDATQALLLRANALDHALAAAVVNEPHDRADPQLSTVLYPLRS